MDLDKNPLQHLLQKLHHALNKVERLPVILNDISGPASGLKYLTQPIKLKLQKAADADASVKDYSENVVLIEPLATVNAVQEFLAPKIRVADFKDTPSKTKTVKSSTELMEVESSKEEMPDAEKPVNCDCRY